MTGGVDHPMILVRKAAEDLQEDEEFWTKAQEAIDISTTP